MSVKVTHSGDGAPRLEWTARHMAMLAQQVRSQFIRRAFDQGRGIDDKPHAPYSTHPMRIYSRSHTARRLGGVGAIDKGAGLRGGLEFQWVRGPRQPGGGYDASRIGETAGKLYVGGYREYKLANRKNLTNSAGAIGTEVDLMLSGRLARSIRVISSTRTEATIGMTGDARTYGIYVDGARPFVGMSPDDRAEAVRLIEEVAATALKPRKAGAK